MSKLRVAVVGAGQFGLNHMRIVSQSEHAELVAVVDLDPKRAEAAATRFCCPALSVLVALLGQRAAAVGSAGFR